MYRVRLINKGVGPTSTQHPVCGKSGKLYGQAAIDYARGGPVFEMSGEDYERDKFDIIGNTKSRQQWVPEFIEVESEPNVVTGPELTFGANGKVVDPLNGMAETIIAGVTNLGNGTTAKQIIHPGREKLRQFNELRQRAKAAGIWKQGMKLHDLEAALLTIPD